MENKTFGKGKQESIKFIYYHLKVSQVLNQKQRTVTGRRNPFLNLTYEM